VKHLHEVESAGGDVLQAAESFVRELRSGQ
jgi:hypothetical protein